MCLSQTVRPRRDIAVSPSSCRNEPFLASLLRGPPACIMVLRQKQPVPPAWGTVGKVSEVTPNSWVFFIFWGALSSHAVSHVPVARGSASRPGPLCIAASQGPEGPEGAPPECGDSTQNGHSLLGLPGCAPWVPPSHWGPGPLSHKDKPAPLKRNPDCRQLNSTTSSITGLWGVPPLSNSAFGVLRK